MQTIKFGPLTLRRRANRLLTVLASSVLCIAAGGTQASGVASGAVSGAVPAGKVGEVSMVLGKAWIHKPDTGPERVQVGTVIGINDSIETASNGHVHIRFVDQALVSLRSSSTLEVVRYDYDPASPASSSVKLNLVEGVTRAISGEAAKNARNNFRMNTPIAAIGVRGTDFVVSAGRETVHALVNEGTIVVAPFSSQCLAEAFGPCSQNGLELTDAIGQILQISANTLNPVLLPISPTGLPESMLGDSIAVPVAAVQREEAAPNSELYTDSVSTLAVNRKIANSVTVTVSDTVAGGGGTKAPDVIPPKAPEFTPAAPVPVQTLTTSQLVWGRWSEGALDKERITTTYAVASAGNRQVAVGNPSYALFRAETGTNAVTPGLGVVGFSLSQAQARFHSDSGIAMMEVRGGNLNIDFNQNNFSTNLQLNHAATGPVQFIDSGRVYYGGYFHSRNPGQSMAGAVSIDGKEAGYFFEKVLENGSIEGLTLWNRQP